MLPFTNGDGPLHYAARGYANVNTSSYMASTKRNTSLVCVWQAILKDPNGCKWARLFFFQLGPACRPMAGRSFLRSRNLINSASLGRGAYVPRVPHISVGHIWVKDGPPSLDHNYISIAISASYEIIRSIRGSRRILIEKVDYLSNRRRDLWS